MQNLPEEPKFVKKVSSIQKILGGLVVSFMAVVILTGFDFVKDVFKPDYVEYLNKFRIAVAFMCLTMTCFIGYDQVLIVRNWVLENYKIYLKIKEMKNIDDKNP